MALDSSGALTAQVTATDGRGASLILPAGTLVLFADGDNGFKAASAGQDVVVSVAALDAHDYALPEAVLPLAQYEIVVALDGVAADAEFVSPALTDGQPGQALGPRLIVTVSKEAIDASGAGLLYQLSTTAPPARIASSPVIGDPELHFPVGGSGRYAAGGLEPGPAPGALPDGTYRSVFTIPDPGCVDIVGSTQQVCGPSVVDVVQILEPSTTEFLGACHFGASDFATTPLWPDGSQFWCQRQQDPVSLTTVVTVAANVANLPVLEASQIRQSDGLQMQFAYISPDGGLELPGGGTTTNPYDDRSLPFGGAMFLTFTSEGDETYVDFKRDAVNAVEAAGYQVSSVRWQRTSQGYFGEFDARGDRDGRKKIGEDALPDDMWQVDASGTRGNLGAFVKGDDYRVEYASGAFLFSGEKCGGYSGPWNIAISGDPDPLVDVSGSIRFDLDEQGRGIAAIEFEMKSTIKAGPRTIVTKFSTEATADVELVDSADRTVLRFTNVDQRVKAGGTDGQINVEFERALNGQEGGLPVERGTFCSGDDS